VTVLRISSGWEVVDRWGPGDVYVYTNGGVGAVVAIYWVKRARYVKWLCGRVQAEMKQWFDSHGDVRVEITGLCWC